VHAEAAGDHAELAAACRDLGMSAGIAVNPPTPIDRITGLVDAFDLVLVMSVHPGFSGQAFIPEVLDKVRAVRRTTGSRVRVEIDGGVTPKNAAACVQAGVDVLVSASAIFDSKDYAGVIAGLRGSGEGR